MWNFQWLSSAPTCPQHGFNGCLADLMAMSQVIWRVRGRRHCLRLCQVKCSVSEEPTVHMFEVFSLYQFATISFSCRKTKTHLKSESPSTKMLHTQLSHDFQIPGPRSNLMPDALSPFSSDIFQRAFTMPWVKWRKTIVPIVSGNCVRMIRGAEFGDTASRNHRWGAVVLWAKWRPSWRAVNIH